MYVIYILITLTHTVNVLYVLFQFSVCHYHIWTILNACCHSLCLSMYQDQLKFYFIRESFSEDLDGMISSPL